MGVFPPNWYRYNDLSHINRCHRLRRNFFTRLLEFSFQRRLALAVVAFTRGPTTHTHSLGVWRYGCSLEYAVSCGLFRSNGTSDPRFRSMSSKLLTLKTGREQATHTQSHFYSRILPLSYCHSVHLYICGGHHGQSRAKHLQWQPQLLDMQMARL